MHSSFSSMAQHNPMRYSGSVTATGNQLQLQLNAALTESDVIEVRYQQDLGPLNNSQGQPIDSFSAVLNTTNTLTAPGIGATAGAVNVYLKDTQTLRSGQSVFVSYNAPIGTGPLQDDAGNRVSKFTQIVSNSVTGGGPADNNGPKLMAGTQGIELLADGKTLKLRFDEQIDRINFANADLKLFVDGQQSAATFRHDLTQLDPADTSNSTLLISLSDAHSFQT